jgi:hypothetical protein
MHPIRNLPTSLAAGAVVMTLFVSMAAADTKGPKLPDIKDLCEREKVERCRWEGDRKICEWVDGPNCLVTRVGPRQSFGPSGLSRFVR